MKKTFWVSGTGTVTFTAFVEAESKEEAKELILKAPLIDLDWETEDTEVHEVGEIEIK